MRTEELCRMVIKNEYPKMVTNLMQCHFYNGSHTKALDIETAAPC